MFRIRQQKRQGFVSESSADQPAKHRLDRVVLACRRRIRRATSAESAPIECACADDPGRLSRNQHRCQVQHLGRYPGAFAWRFNRRFELDRMIERLAYVACRTAPLPYKFATMAEVHT